MSDVNRRTFVQLSSGALLSAASRKLLGVTSAPTVTREGDRVRVSAGSYSWEYTQADDTFRILDVRHQVIVSGKLQPAVVVAPAEQPLPRVSKAGHVAKVQAEPGRVTVQYEGVNGGARLSTSWRFDEHGIWTDPITYESTAVEDIVSLHYFSEPGPTPTPTLRSSFIISPGITSSSTISPIMRDWNHLDTNVWLGRGSYTVGLNQQWALPVHYFCGFSAGNGARNSYTEERSEAFTCGLADLPDGDFFLQFSAGFSSPWIDYRGDLWKHMRGPAKFTLGATLLWTVAPDYYQSIAAYYETLLQAGIIHRKQNSERKNAITLTPEFCTWGAQVARDSAGEKLTDAFLDEVYQQFKQSGMKAGLFSIDDKWEGAYGNLVHSSTRLPRFEEFLARVRGDGIKIGMWAAVMRCQNPSDLGLTTENMLQTPEGKPFVIKGWGGSHDFYILDFTQPEVAKVLTDAVKRFIRRYKPDVFKFDFGYELPAVSAASPRDKTYTGERLMWKGLQVVINAMREENPDQVVMYYNLSPLFLDFFDLHSLDDLVVSVGDYDVEANRRCFFSSLLGRLGVPTYGSSGYDWSSSPSIWFDSAAVGTVGSLNDFHGDEEGETPTPEIIAKYNGITHVLRSSTRFEIIPIGNISQSATLGARARSWARMEDGKLVLVAYRPEAPGQERLLSHAQTDSRVQDVVRANVPVVVASKDADSIALSAQLAIAPYGGGEITVRRQQGKQAAVVSHYFGGTAIKSTAAVEGGLLTLHAVERNAEGKPLEWMEVLVS